MPVTMIDSKGLLGGKRLRRLSLKARLYYPVLLSMANTFARVELDYDLLTDALASFRDPDIGNLPEWFREYEANSLLFIYDGPDAGTRDASPWGVFDTRAEYRRSFPTKEDRDSPAPPAEAYAEWLRSIHGDDWQAYDLNAFAGAAAKSLDELKAKRSEAGRLGGLKSGVSRQTKQKEAFASGFKQTKHDGDGDGDVVVDEDVDDEVDVDNEYVHVHVQASSKHSSVQHLSTNNNQTSINHSSQEKGKSHTVGEECQSEGEALSLTHAFHELVLNNPHCVPSKIPSNWESIWIKDFVSLLRMTDYGGAAQLLVFTQGSPDQQRFTLRPAKLVENVEVIASRLDKLKRDNPDRWNRLWNASFLVNPQAEQEAA